MYHTDIRRLDPNEGVHYSLNTMYHTDTTRRLDPNKKCALQPKYNVSHRYKKKIRSK
jgi:hypothetical protein